jgi:F-type H+-transporting ATPase subunit delta
MTSNEYALALFESLEKQERTDVVEWFHLIEDIVTSQPDYIRLMRSPNITDEVKKQLLSDVFSLSPETFLHFLYVVIDQDRFGDIVEIASIYQTMMYQQDQVMVVQVITAKPLVEKQQVDLQKTLQSTYQKTIVLQEKVQPELIGGIRLEFQGKVLDQSIKSQANRLQQSLRKGT